MPHCRFTFASVLSAAFAATVPLACATTAAHAQETPPPTPPPAPAAAPPAAEPTPAPTDNTSKKRKRFPIGVEAGAYFPSSGKTRDTFGDTWYNYGIGFGAIETADAKGRFQFDFNLIAGARSGNRAYFAPIGASYRRALTTGKSTTPYFGASVDVIPTYLKAPRDDVHSRLRFAGGGSVFAGFTFSSSAYIQARYYGTSKSAGFDLSGLNVSAGIRF